MSSGSVSRKLAPLRGCFSNFCCLPATGDSGGLSTDSTTCGCVVSIGGHARRLPEVFPGEVSDLQREGTMTSVFRLDQTEPYFDARSSTVSSSTLAPLEQSCQCVISLGEWLMPATLGTKIMPIGIRGAIICAS